MYSACCIEQICFFFFLIDVWLCWFRRKIFLSKSFFWKMSIWLVHKISNDDKKRHRLQATFSGGDREWIARKSACEKNKFKLEKLFMVLIKGNYFMKIKKKIILNNWKYFLFVVLNIEIFFFLKKKVSKKYFTLFRLYQLFFMNQMISNWQFIISVILFTSKF
jgi:hypothetical protein